MTFSHNLVELVQLNAPFWAGEAEVARTYFASDKRNAETDKAWLKRQCWKEYAGIGDSQGKTIGMVSDLEVKLREMVPELDKTVDRHELLDILETVYVEYKHYCLFADIYDQLRADSEPKMDPNKLETWEEEERLASRRRQVRKEYGEIGARASSFTEGGYCTLYSEGAKLSGRPGLDGQIGKACQVVFDDEFGHAMKGIAGVDKANLSEADWDLLKKLTVEQLEMRIHMRNAQFGHPLSDKRVEEILSGKIEPIDFDYKKAESYV
jgi:hypothetical protein